MAKITSAERDAPSERRRTRNRHVNTRYMLVLEALHPVAPRLSMAILKLIGSQKMKKSLLRKILPASWIGLAGSIRATYRQRHIGQLSAADAFDEIYRRQM